MKSLSDPRHQKRRKLVQEIFAHEFKNLTQPLSDSAKEVIEYSAVADPKIHEAAPMWPIERLNKVDLAILRLAVFELENKAAPAKVIIDEAVELAKEFGSESSSSFVNGVLGTILKKVGEYMDNSKNEEKLITILSAHLGVNPSDLDLEDRIKEDLHVTMKDFSELMDRLEEMDINTSMVDFSKTETVADLAASVIFKEA